MDSITQILITILGSGAFISFVQFLIQRHDNKSSKIDELCEKIEEEIELQDKTSKERYSLLQQEIEKGLEARENLGKERYLEHKEAIQKLNEAIFQLTKNDTSQNEYMKNIGNSLIGLSHDKIMRLSDKYLERGGITLKEKTTLKSIYDPYRVLGGNGDCQVAYEQVDHLPIISEEKVKELDKSGKD